MKKKILAALVAILIICIPLTACSESYTGTSVGEMPEDTYAVISNGGSAVQYGKYIYFINGYRGYTDDDGKSNLWGSVVKGGLYRAKLLDGKDVKFDYYTPFGQAVSLNSYEGGYDEEHGFNFVTTEEEVKTGYERDDDGNIVYENGEPVEKEPDIVTVAKAELIASKTVGTSGYSNGGLFIYDEYIYYASPSNHQSKDGTFEVNKTVFFRTKLDGSKTIKLYETENDGASSPYAFYNQNGKVYLVVQDGTNIISVEVGEKKVEAVREIATDVSSVLFPVKKIYYKGMDTNSVEDFVYYTRALGDDDEFEVRTGNVAVAVRPDGTESSVIVANGNTITLKNTDNGYLFYEDAKSSGTEIVYTNLHEQFMQCSETYKTAYEKIKSDLQTVFGANSVLIGHQSGVALDNEASYSQIICFRPDTRSNQVYSLLQESSALSIYDGLSITQIYSGTVGEVYAIDGNEVYFGDGSGSFYRTNVYNKTEDNTAVKLGESMITTPTFDLDVVGRFVVLYGEVDDYASDYAFFLSRDKEWTEKQFVGVKSDIDKYDISVELNEGTEDDDSTADAN